MSWHYSARLNTQVPSDSAIQCGAQTLGDISTQSQEGNSLCSWEDGHLSLTQIQRFAAGRSHRSDTQQNTYIFKCLLNNKTRNILKKNIALLYLAQLRWGFRGFCFERLAPSWTLLKDGSNLEEVGTCGRAQVTGDSDLKGRVRTPSHAQCFLPPLFGIWTIKWTTHSTCHDVPHSQKTLRLKLPKLGA